MDANRNPWSAASLARPTAVGTAVKFRELSNKAVVTRPVVTTQLCLCAFDVVRYIKTLGGDPFRPRKRGSAPRGGAHIRVNLC